LWWLTCGLVAAWSSRAVAQTTMFNGVEVPGVVIAHTPKSTGRHLASPAFTILPDGDYVASHNVSGDGPHYTRVYRSADRGVTWEHLSTIPRQTWASLFVHRDALYVLGPSAPHGELLIRRSDDGGRTWTTPDTPETGRLLSKDPYGYHTAPVPIVTAAGRVWRAYEDDGGGGEWPRLYRARMMSAPVDSDLLNAASWTHTNALVHDPAWLVNEGFQGWLEGNAVIDRDGSVVNVLRVDVGKDRPEVAAIARLADETTLTFDPARDIVPMPGGAKKFTIHYHAGTDAYWTLANVVDGDNNVPAMPPRWIRNKLAVLRSDDLTHWTVHRVVLSDLSDVRRIGFHYFDWQFDGRDMVGVARTAFPDGFGGASSYHNANFFNFFRFTDVIPDTTTSAVRGGVQP